MNYLLAVSGSIASYKAYDVARGLIKNGHNLKVILTKGALEFIRADTFKYLGAQDVYLPEDDFNLQKLSPSQTVLHVELAKWADKLIIAPLSANTLGRLSLGLNNDLLVSLFLAFGVKPVVLFPAMNTQMLHHPRVQSHLHYLKSLTHVGVINPTSGPLACGDIGEGKFPPVEAVIELVETFDPTTLTSAASLKHILITAGATAAPLDPVRYLTNPSTGRMGLATAAAFLKRGYQVTILAGHQCVEDVEFLEAHPQCRVIKTPTTSLMKEAALLHFKTAHLYISTGAIADIEFDVSGDKIKKEKMGTSLAFHQAPDILAEILKMKTPLQKVISFAAETQTSNDIFEEKMKRKPVDLMIGNKVASGLVGSDEMIGFKKNDGHYFFITQESISPPVALSKRNLAEKLVQWFEGF